MRLDPTRNLMTSWKSHAAIGLQVFLIVMIWHSSTNADQGTMSPSSAHQDHQKSISLTPTFFAAQSDSIAPDSTGMGTLPSVELAKQMVPGWNIGNSLDAIGGETAWGNPLITQRLIDSVKAAGFQSVRIPVAWSRFTDTSTYTIDTTWLARVEQVVNYVLHDSMYAIINEHWDGGWQQPVYADSVYVNRRLAAMWKQIAIHFREYGNHLLFAGLNEVMVTNNYNAPTAEYSKVQNSFNQTFVTAVRSTGGRNAYRYLLAQGFNTNIDFTISSFVIPTDPTPNRLMVEVHYYDPYDFTINTGSSITQWGMYAKDASKTETWANETYVDRQFQKMKAKFIDHGYAVVLGEYGVIARLNLGSADLNATFAAYRLYYMRYVTRSMERHGIVPIYWDNGGTGNYGMGIFNRSTGAQAYPAIVDAIVDTNNVGPVVGVRDQSRSPTEVLLGQNYPNPFNPKTVISGQLTADSKVRLVIYDLLGREIAVLADGKYPAGKFAFAFDGANLASGVYFCRLTAGTYAATKAMVLEK